MFFLWMDPTSTKAKPNCIKQMLTAAVIIQKVLIESFMSLIMLSNSVFEKNWLSREDCRGAG